MRIAQVAPLAESVPPQGYGGTERVVHYLVEELVALGHQVTLFASGDSVTSAELVPGCERALRRAGCRYPIAPHVLMLDRLMARSDAFDVIHFHLDLLHFPLLKREPLAAVTTLHGRLDTPELIACFRAHPELSFVSISNSQRRPLPELDWLGTVYHGLPLELYAPGPGPWDYALFLGRLSPEKGVERAIEVAGQAGLQLVVAAKINDHERPYVASIEPLLRQPHVRFIGEIDDAEKGRLLGGARALLFPIEWPEPFGLVMIEAMACGTPVLAWARGSVPEVVDDGVTGWVVGSVGEAVAALRRIEEIDRPGCRRRFEQRFNSRRMARDYVEVYRALLRRKRRGGRASPAAAHRGLSPGQGGF